MARGRVDIGPLRCVRGPRRDIVDVHFDGTVLALTSYDGAWALLNRYRAVLLAVAILVTIAGWYADGPGRVASFVVAAVLAGVAAALVGAEAVLGRRGSETRTEVRETDIELMDRLVEGARPLLVLHTTQGEVALSGFPWRASQLRRLQIELGRE